jgi:hypothetical protein
VIYVSAFSTALTLYQSESGYLTLKMNTYICRIIHHILDMVVSGPFYNRYVKLPPKDQTPPEIWDNPKLYSRIVVGIDGTHIDAFVPDDAVARYHNHKCSLLQNVLAACIFDMWFCYVLSG